MMPTASSKRWFLGTVATFLTLIFCAFFVVNILIDPTGERRWIETDFNRNKYVGGSLWHLIRKLSEKQYTLFFGSSRVHVFSSEIMGEPVLNFSALYRNPGDVYAFLSLLTEREWKNIRHVYFLIDLDGLFYEDRFRQFSSRYDFFWDESTNLNFLKIRRAWDCVRKNLTNDPDNIVDRDGNVIVRNDRYYGDVLSLSLDKKHVSPYCLEHLRKIGALCKAHGIGLTFFTYSTPEDISFYKPYVAQTFRRLLTVVDGFYDFLDLPELKGRRDLFTDESHLNTEGGKLVAARLKDPARPFYVTAANNPLADEPFGRPDIGRLMEEYPRGALSDSGKILLLEALAFARHTDPQRLARSLLRSISPDYAGFLFMELMYAKRHEWLKFLLDRPERLNLNILSPPLFAPSEEASPVCELSLLNRWQQRTALLYLKDRMRVDAPGSRGATPLVLAAGTGNAYLTGMLLACGASPDRPAADGLTPLAYALRNGHEETARLLLAHGADPDDRSPGGDTALHLLAARGMLQGADLCLRLGARPDPADASGRTPLMLAVDAGHADLVRLLVERGADPWLRDNLGRSALDRASGRAEMLELLRRDGAGG